MGRLINQPLRGLFQGVSRQPPEFRLPGQMDAAENALFSVFSGGASPRYGTQLVASTAYANLAGYAWHAYARDQLERYQMVVDPVARTVRVWDQNGTERSVVIPSGAEAVQDYLAGIQSQADASFTTIGDLTLIANKNVSVAMDDIVANLASGYGTDVSYAVVWMDGVTNGGRYSMRLRAVKDGIETEHEVEKVAQSASTSNVLDHFYDDLPMNWGPPVANVYQSRTYLIIELDDLYDLFEVGVSEDSGSGHIHAVTNYVQEADDLPAVAPDGMVVRVGSAPENGENTEGFQYFKYVRTEGDDFGNTGATLAALDLGVMSRKGHWEETIGLGVPLFLDYRTMPVGLLREPDGTFTLAPLAEDWLIDAQGEAIYWKERPVGDEDSAPDPGFVGSAIQDIGIHRDRVYFIAGENIFFTQAGDYFNFWPESVADVIDSDPFDRVAGATGRVSNIVQATSFRDKLFLSSAADQYEVTGDPTLTPDGASIHLSTSYQLEPLCGPERVGEELYFASTAGKYADVLEYFYVESAQSNTAARITSHIPGYIPAPIVQLVGDSVGGWLFARTPSDPQALYAYRFYREGDEKQQSAWARWTFPGFVGHLSVDNRVLRIVCHQDIGQDPESSTGTVYFVTIPLEDADHDPLFPAAPANIRLDNKVVLTGGTSDGEQTSFTLPSGAYPDTVVAVVTESASFANASYTIGEIISLTRSAGDVYVSDDPELYQMSGKLLAGVPFETTLRFSPQYLRDQQALATQEGVLKLRTFSVNFEPSGPFTLKVTPEKRSTRSYSFEPIGPEAADLMLLREGRKTVPVRGRGDKTLIEVTSTSHLPFTLTSAAWIGFYNEITRQD